MNLFINRGRHTADEIVATGRAAAAQPDEDVGWSSIHALSYTLALVMYALGALVYIYIVRWFMGWLIP